MKLPIINKNKFCDLTVLIDDCDYSLVAARKWRIRCHIGKNLYVHSLLWDKETNKQGSIHLHRLIMNCPPGLVVDHINGNGLDNRRCNLRICTIAENSRNGRQKRHYKKHKGTSLNKRTNKWESFILLDRKKYHLGSYWTELEAAEAYNQAAIKYHGIYARLNKLDGQ